MAERRMSGSALCNHFVICNWNDLGDDIVRQLHAAVTGDMRPIVIVTETPEAVPQTESTVVPDPYRNVFVIPGDPTSDRILARANIAAADTAIVLSDPSQGPHADTKSVLIALAIEAIEPQVHTIVELLSSKNRIQFQHTSVDEVICVDELTEKLLAQAAITHGLSEFYTRLLTATDDTNEVYAIDVPEAFHGKTYRELEAALISYTEEDVILVGVQTIESGTTDGQVLHGRRGATFRDRLLTINPHQQAEGPDVELCVTRDHVLTPDDRVFVIGYRPPTLTGLVPV